MSRRIDWPGLVQAGLHGLALEPRVFWALTPVELRIMLGAETQAPPLTRARLAELAAAFPDLTKGDQDDRSTDTGRGSGRIGRPDGGLGRDGGGL